MAAENPNWHIMQHQTHSISPLFSLLHDQLSLHGDGGSPNNSSSSSSSSIPLLDQKSPHQQPWSQILMSGAEEESLELNTPNNPNMLFGHDHDDHHHEHQFIKQTVYGHGDGHGHGHGHGMDYHHDMSNMTHMSNSYATVGGAPKKPRVQSSSIPPLKVRKEKLGDRITALHQLVSPFGKNDTASVLIETMGCIRFLQAQIQVLSSPYFDNPPSKNHHFNYIAKDESVTELRSKGLCLVPITSLTQFVGTENNSVAEYWAPSLADGF